jgi:hypothetical protein
MKISRLFLGFACLSLFSCQKEVHYTDSNTNVVDTSALAKFINATGIVDPQLKVNLDSLIARAKRHGWWDLCNVIYPLAGGNAESCKYNLKDPKDADAAFRLSFIGGTWIFTSVAANPGATGYGRTYFNPSAQIADPNSCHLSVYSMDDVPGDRDNADIGAYDDITHSGFYLSTRDSFPDNSGKPLAEISAGAVQGTSQNGAGFFLATKTSSSHASLYWGPSSVAEDNLATTGALPNLNLFICNQNFSGSPEPYPAGFSHRGLAFVTIGAGINSSIEALMYSDINDFVENK